MCATNTNHWEDPSDGTLAVGVGGRLQIRDRLALLAEWTAALSGYEAGGDGVGVGLEYEVGGHVFQVVGTNVVGIAFDQFVPGSSPELGTRDLRIGFTIFRTFWL
jgi:hypothetical protein